MKIHVRGSVLRSVRESRNIPLHIAAEKLQIKKGTLEQWEREGAYLSKPRIIRITSFYKYTWYTLIQDDPVTQVKIEKQYRKIVEPASRLSTKTILAFDEARHLLDSIAELNLSPPASATSMLEGPVPRDPLALARAVREKLGISTSEQKRFRTLTEAQERWTEAVSSKGIYVQHLEFPIEDARAFSLRSHGRESIVLSSKDTIGGRIFSLMHELGHLLKGQTGLCDLEGSANRQIENQERFCNQFAAELLVPEEELQISYTPQALANADDRVIGSIADKYKVSGSMIFLRLVELGHKPSSEFDEYQERTKEELKKIREKGRAGFVDVFQQMVLKQSRKFTRELLTAFAQNKVSYRDLGVYLNVNRKNINKIEQIINE